MPRSRGIYAVSAAVLLALVVVPTGSAAASNAPVGFSDTVVATLPAPTGLAWTPDGRMLVTQQAGLLRVVRDGALKPTPALDLTGSDCNNSERGLLSVVVDPAFATNHYVYLYWTNNAHNSCEMNTPAAPENRVARYVLGDDDLIDQATELVIVDHIPSPNGNHNAGDLHFGADKLLYISVGDGGCSLTDATRCQPLNDNSRRLDIPLGKILRVTSTGEAPDTNPYAGATGARHCTDPAGVPPGTGPCTETFGSGFRNPFRFAQRPGTSAFYVNDVGQNTWEEIDSLTAGADYGWNVREGHCATESSTDCGPSAYADPIHDYPHTTGCESITGGAFVPTGLWPAPYSGAYLFSDYVCGKVFRLAPRSGGGYRQVTFLDGLGAKSAVNLAFGPYQSTSALYYTTYGGGGQVRRVTYSGANSAPVAAFSTTLGGANARTLTANGSASYDPDGGDSVVRWSWDFGDGSTAVTTTPKTTHTYAAVGSYAVSLVVTDSRGLVSAPVSHTVLAGNRPPTVTITSPPAGARFAVGRSVTVTATASDPEDGALPANSISWTIVRVHGNHTHPWLSGVTGSSVTTTYPQPEDLASTTDSWLRVTAVARDSAGVTGRVSRKLLPHLVTLQLASVPTGARVTVNDVGFTTPADVVSWQGWVVHLAAAGQVVGGRSYVFASWSDGGNAAHDVTTPATDTTYKVTFNRG